MRKKKGTAEIYFNKYKPQKNGKCPVSIRIRYNAQRKHYDTGIRTSPEEYDAMFSPNIPVAFSKQAKFFKTQKAVLEELKNKAQDIINSLKEFSWTLFEKQFIKKTGDRENVFSILQERAAQLKEENRVSMGFSFNCTLNSLKKFHKKDRLTFDDIDIDFLERYKSFMTASGNSNTTTGIYLRNLRTIFNEAIDDAIVPKELYPFGKGKRKFKIPTGRNIKKALTLQDIGKILEYTPVNSSEAKARDFWIFSYLGNGLNVKDIALLKFRNIYGDMIRFERAKTKRVNEDKPITISFPITKEIGNIIENRRNKLAFADNFIFPILQGHENPIEQYKKIQLFTAFINKNMRKVAKALDIQANITTYVARHSFSTILRNSGTNVAAISEALGHKSVKTTENYLAGFEDEEKKKMASLLTNFSKLKVV